MPGLTLCLKASSVSGTPSMRESPFQMTPALDIGAHLHKRSDQTTDSLCPRRLTITVKNKCINFVNEISLLLLRSLLHCVTPDLVRLWEEIQKVSPVSMAITYLHRFPQPASGCGSEAVVLVTCTLDCAVQKVRSGVRKRSAGRRDLSKSFPKPCFTWA